MVGCHLRLLDGRRLVGLVVLQPAVLERSFLHYSRMYDYLIHVISNNMSNNLIYFSSFFKCLGT